MKPVTKWTIRWFILRTQCVVAFWVIVGTIVGLGFGGVVAALLLRDYIHKRDHMLLDLRRQLQGELSEDEQIAAMQGEIHDAFIKHHRRLLESDHADSRNCLTCGSEMFLVDWNEVDLCPQLRESNPHNPRAIPAPDNPFAWWWYQVHGYAPPPPDWPSQKPYVAIEGLGSSPIESMRLAGVEHWSEYRNHAWDSGFAEAPQWYVDHWIDQTVAA